MKNALINTLRLIGAGFQKLADKLAKGGGGGGGPEIPL
tara:strand:+ start:1908 stop:2021 length:114 start_codon:yes stop_codon:yes gene_type:complete